MFLGQRNKYERPNYSGVRTIQLRSIVDGHTRTFVDDGPFETTRDWMTLPPNGQRQQLIRYIQKRCPGDDSLPLYFADSPQPELFHPMIGKISIPVVNDAIRAKMAEFAPYMAERQQRGIEAVKSAKAAEEYKAQAQAAAMESALKNALADIVAAPAAAKRGRPAKGEESPNE